MAEQLNAFQKEIGERLNQRMELPHVLKDPVHRLEFIDPSSIEALKNNISRLGDYMVRAQQLITMLVAQDRLSPAVQQAMKRVDWNKVKTQFPEAIKTSHEILEKTQRHYEENTHV